MSVFHSQEAFQKSAPGDQIVRPEPIDCHNRGVGVLVGESLHDVCDALTTRLCRQGVLERGSGRLCFLGKLFCDGSGH